MLANCCRQQYNNTRQTEYGQVPHPLLLWDGSLGRMGAGNDWSNAPVVSRAFLFAVLPYSGTRASAETAFIVLNAANKSTGR